MNKIDFSQYQREDKLGIIISVGFIFRKFINAFWVVIVYLLINLEFDIFKSYISYLVIFLIIALLFLHSYLSWKNFYFYIKDDEFIIEKGYLKKSITSLPLNRIVSVNTNQKLLHQLLNVVELEVDSSGTESKEVKIGAIKKDFAIALEKAMMQSSEVVDNKANEDNQTLNKDTEIINLKPINLLKIGIARNHMTTFLFVLVFINQVYNRLEDFFREELDEVYTDTVLALENSDVLFWTILIIAGVLLTIILSMLRTFISYFDFKLLKINKALLIQSGLIKKRKITMPFTKIQACVRFTNPLQRLLKIVTVKLVQANSKTTAKDSQKVIIPGCNTAQAVMVGEMVVNTNYKNFIELKPHKIIKRRLIMIKSLLLIPFIVGVFYYVWVLLLCVVLIILIFFISNQEYKRVRYFINNEILVVKKGFILQSTTCFKTYKIQAIHLKQNFFQSRRGVANLVLGIAGIEVTLDYLDYNQAMQIKDSLLHSVNNSNKSWM